MLQSVYSKLVRFGNRIPYETGNKLILRLVKLETSRRMVQPVYQYNKVDLLDYILCRATIDLSYIYRQDCQNVLHVVAQHGTLSDISKILRSTSKRLQEALRGIDIMGFNPIEVASLHGNIDIMIRLLQELRGKSYPYSNLFEIYKACFGDSNHISGREKARDPQVEIVLRVLAFHTNIKFDRRVHCIAKQNLHSYLLFSQLPFFKLDINTPLK